MHGGKFSHQWLDTFLIVNPELGFDADCFAADIFLNGETDIVDILFFEQFL
jgi:hypothetical protein